MSTIKAIFFARFHPAKGPQVLHQVPDGAIMQSHGSDNQKEDLLFDFGAISGLIIPSQEFCDRLITVCINRYRIISYPVCVESSKYERNEFIFNFALVLDEDEDFSGYTTIVRKLALLFRNLEEQSGFLSREEQHLEDQNTDIPSALELDNSKESTRAEFSHGSHSLGGKIYALCEMMFEDLNHYCECMIPIDESNTINLKIFPTRPPPAPIFAWHVPLATVQLSMLSNSSDLTLTRILPFIDGVTSVSQIAQMADTDINLTKKAIAHLLYYDCVILLDIFQYSAIYAPTAEIGSFVEDTEAQDEAIRYIAVGRYRRLTEQEVSQGSTGEQWGWKSDETTLDNVRLIQLYLSLKQGVTLKNWCLERNTLLMGIDVRRFITFGVIKGFLYRVHKYALLDGTAVTNENNLNKAGEEFTFDPERIEHWRVNSRRGSAAGSPGRDLPLAKYLDGMHSFDEICTELQLGEKEVTDRMKDIYKNVTFIYR